MYEVYEGIGFALDSFKNFEDKDFASSVIEILLSAPEFLRPHNFKLRNEGEKYRKIDCIETIVNSFMGLTTYFPGYLGPKSIALSLQNKGKSTYLFSWEKLNKDRVPPIQSLNGNVELKLFENHPEYIDELYTLIKSLAAVINPAYGEVYNSVFETWDPMNLSIGLPDIKYVNIYGNEYVELFGRTLIESAPFDIIEEIATNCYWLEVKTSIFEPIPPNKKTEIKKHFGEEAFLNAKKSRSKFASDKAPKFDFSQIILDY
jgi:hypothetical protein